MATKKHVVTDGQYRDIDRRMTEIKRQLNQDGGSPLAPERVMQSLQWIVEGVKLAPTTTRAFTVWKTITVGGKTWCELQRELLTNDFAVGSWVNDLVTHHEAPFASRKPMEIDLVIVTPRELGFSEYPTIAQIWARAKKLGFELCPAEVGPYLRLVYTDQPQGEFLLIGMEQITVLVGPKQIPISNSLHCPFVFKVVYGYGKDERRALDGQVAWPTQGIDYNYRIVFVLPRGY